MFLLLTIGLFWQEFYFIDGVELHLDNGSVIKTAEEIKEDIYFYSWREEGAPISIEKRRVRAIHYFSMRVEGRPEYKPYKNSVRRRITGLSVAYERDGATYLKCRHVTARGRPAEGHNPPNFISEIMIAEKGEQEQTLSLSFSRATAGTRVAIRFYDLKGVLRYQSFLPMEESTTYSKKKGSGGTVLPLTVPASIDLTEMGLVEVTTQEP